jgi:hypothetical protein
MGKMGCLNLHSFGLESTMTVNLGSWREWILTGQEVTPSQRAGFERAFERFSKSV